MKLALEQSDIAAPAPKDAMNLEEALQRFIEASSKLELRYHEIVAETKSLRTQLDQKEQQIKRAERLATLGKTAAAMAHEIRNPLGAITLFVSLLKNQLSQDPAAQEIIVQIERSAAVLEHVVKNILLFSRPEKRVDQPVQLQSLIEQFVGEARLRWPHLKIELTGDSLGYILGCSNGLHQVFSNLLLNAVECAPRDSKLDLHTECVGEFYHVCIRDYGPGIPEEALSSIFEPFVSLKKNGTGLGLAVVQHIMAQHDAKIEVENCSPGARFRLIFKVPNKSR